MKMFAPAGDPAVSGRKCKTIQCGDRSNKTKMLFFLTALGRAEYSRRKLTGQDDRGGYFRKKLSASLARSGCKEITKRTQYAARSNKTSDVPSGARPARAARTGIVAGSVFFENKANYAGPPHIPNQPNGSRHRASGT
jgi:hypothetical protein